MPASTARRRSYVMHGVLAAGGMATVHLGLLLAPGGFARRVAIKRLHPQLAADPEVAAAFAEEARLSARITHANVAAMLDVISEQGELLLVMEYVHGETLSRLLSASRRYGTKPPVGIVVSVLAGVLHGLHAAHEATDEQGAPLRLVHRDVSPQNVIVGTDGVARVVDFGIAKALGCAHVTRDGQVKGKMPYMAPEQLLRRGIDRRVDTYGAGVLLWEALAGQRLFHADEEPTLWNRVLEEVVQPPSTHNPNVPAALDAIVMRAIERDPERRFATAREMALELESIGARAPASAVAEWVTTTAHEALEQRNARLVEMEREARTPSDEAALPTREQAASVVFRATPASGSEPALRASDALSLSNAMRTPITARSRRRRSRIGLALLAVVAVLGSAGIVALAAGRRPPNAPVPAAAEPREPERARGRGPDEEARAVNASIAPAPLPLVTTSRVLVSSTPAPPRTGAAAERAAPSTQWCKVFDPTKRIFVMKSMRVVRCP